MRANRCKRRDESSFRSVGRQMPRKCREPTCAKQPNYGEPGGPALFCRAHCLPGHELANGRKCAEAGCAKMAYF